MQKVCRWKLFTITANSLLTIMTLWNSLTGLIIMTATVSVWNPLASIGFLYLTTLKIVILILLSLIQSMLNHRKVKKNWFFRFYSYRRIISNRRSTTFLHIQLRVSQLRYLSRYRYKITNFIYSEKNRVQNYQTFFNISLASVVSDPFDVVLLPCFLSLLPVMSMKSISDPYFVVPWKREVRKFSTPSEVFTSMMVSHTNHYYHSGTCNVLKIWSLHFVVK